MNVSNEDRNVLVGAAACGLMGLVTEALSKLDPGIALGLLKKVELGLTGLSFGVMIRGPAVEIVAHAVEGTDSMHLVTVRQTMQTSGQQAH
jgi:hypothetical protein